MICLTFLIQLQSELSLCAEAYIYNMGVASWEPLIEPVEDYETAEYRPWTFRAKVTYAKSKYIHTGAYKGKERPTLVSCVVITKSKVRRSVLFLL